MSVTLTKHLGPWRPQLLSILRIVTALLFLEHGTAKLFGFPASQMPSAAALSAFWWIGVLELVGGVLLVVGLFTRIAAFILSGEMAVAYFLAHATQSFYPLQNGGEFGGALLLRLPVYRRGRARRLGNRQSLNSGASSASMKSFAALHLGGYLFHPPGSRLCLLRRMEAIVDGKEVLAVEG